MATRMTDRQEITLASGQRVIIKEDGANFSIHFIKAGPMKVTGIWLTGEGKDVEIDLEKT